MNTGVTLLFKIKNSQEIKEVLKSLVIDTSAQDFFESVLDIAKKIEKPYDYNYLGLNDIFVVSGIAQEASLLGRTTFYELNELSKAKTIISKEFSYNDSTELKTFNCSLVYFCKNQDKEKYTISVLSIVNTSVNEVIEKVNLLSESKDFIKRIKNNSIDKINDIKFVGIEDILEDIFPDDIDL